MVVWSLTVILAWLIYLGCLLFQVIYNIAVRNKRDVYGKFEKKEFLRIVVILLITVIAFKGISNLMDNLSYRYGKSEVKSEELGKAVIEYTPELEQYVDSCFYRNEWTIWEFLNSSDELLSRFIFKFDSYRNEHSYCDYTVIVSPVFDSQVRIGDLKIKETNNARKLFVEGTFYKEENQGKYVIGYFLDDIGKVMHQDFDYESTWKME